MFWADAGEGILIHSIVLFDKFKVVQQLQQNM